MRCAFLLFRAFSVSLAGVSFLAFPMAFLMACSENESRPTSTQPTLPDTLHWSLDIDFAGEAELKGLRRDTVITAWIEGEVSGRVNGFDSKVAQDTLRFRNVEHPELIVNAGIDSAGHFSFPSFDLLGGLDGAMTLWVTLQSRVDTHVLRPDTLVIGLNREQ